jgi:LmbE family N-acetylglucosaminyl deacetylase
LKILYIFPHPDDESFGPAAAIHSQIKNGHQVYLLTLTRGGATKERHKLGLSVEEMGAIRLEEMKQVEKTLKLEWMNVLDFPDSGLKEMDPRILEQEVKKHLAGLKPEIVVTYPIHGISGFHDHIVTHSVVKRAYLELKDAGAFYLKRLAFFTMPDNGKPTWQSNGSPRLKHTEQELIDCIMPLEKDDIEALKKALECYKTYKGVIEETGVIDKIGDKLYFEIAGEGHDPVLGNITEGIEE